MPDSNRDFRLDPKSRPAGELAWHLTSSDVQMLDEIADHKFDMAPRFKQESRNIADLVNWYETNFLRAANRVRAMTPGQLATPVDFAGVFKMPAVFYLGFVNNHSVHHRGQLAAYLRPMGSRVPSIYGRSVDKPWNG